MSHTHGNSDNQKVSIHDDSLSDVNIKVEKFYLSPLSEEYQKEGILITAETEKSTTEKRISLELEHPDHFGLLQFNYKGPESDDYFPLNSTVKIKEIVLGKTINERDNFEDRVKYIFRDDIKYIITKKGSDCCSLCEAAIEDDYIVVLCMKLEIMDTNNSFRRFAFYLDDGSSTLLCRAIRKKNMETIEVLLNFKFDIDARNKAGLTPLHVAVDLQMSDVNIKILNSLLRNQANLNTRDEIGRTPLHYAVDVGNVVAVDILLKRGADYTLENESIFTPFHLAAKHANLDMIKVFLDNNVDANIVNSRKQTPLYVIGKKTFTKTRLGIETADKDTYLKTINALLKKGANINFLDFTGNTPLHHAVMNENSAFIQALLACNADPAIKNIYGDNVLHLACRSQQADNCVQDILNSNVDIDAVNRDGDTALHLAMQQNDDNIVELILKKNPNIHMKNNIGDTALHKAVKFKRYRLIDLLLQNGANVDLKDASGRTVLLLAAKLPKIRIEIIEAILNYTNDIDVKDKRGRTPLHRACWNGNVEAVKYLIQNGADSSMRDRDERTVFHYSCMIKRGLYQKIRKAFEDLLHILVEEDVSVNCVDKFGKTPLHYVVEKGDDWSFNLHEPLLEIGADIDIEDKDHNTVIDTLLKQCDTYQYGKLKPFIEHVIKMKEMGMWVHEKTLDNFNKVNDQSNSQKIQLYERDCRKEIDLMNINIDQSDLTYYNFLKMSPHRAMNYSRNENVVNTIKSDELLAVFPIYGHFLKCHLRDIQWCRYLYEKIQRFSKSSIFERLPIDCMHEIFQYLNKFDLDNFLQALRPVVLIK